MIAPEYFNNHIAIEGEIIVKRVPNDTGSVLVWNSTTKKISTRTHADIIADLSLVTTNTNQNVTGLKSFITSGGNYAPFNNSLQIYSDDGSNPSMTYSKGGAYVGQTMFDETGFHFKNGDNNAYYKVRAKGFIKEDGDNNSVLLDGGGSKPISEFVSTNHTHTSLYNNQNNDTVDSHTLLDDNKFKFVHRISAGSSNLFPTSNNANSIVAIATHPGGYGSLLGINSDNEYFSKHISAGNYAPTWKQFAYRDWVLQQIPSVVNFVPYTGATQDLELNNRSIFYSQKVHSYGSHIHGHLGLSVLTDATGGYVENPLIKIGALSGNMITFTVKLYNYPLYFYEFQVNIYIYQNNVYAPTITWRAGDSAHIDRVEFFKDPNTSLYYIRPIIAVAYPRLAITDVQGYGGDGTFFNENWSVVWGGDTTPFLLQGTINSGDFSGDSRVVNTHKTQEITARKVINKDLGTNEYIGVAQHNAQFQVGRRSDAKSLEFAVTDDGTAYIQSKEAGVGYHPLILNRNNSGGVAIGGTPVNNHGLTIGSTVYSVDGYYKQGFDNNYFLLAGGGTQLKSDFALNFDGKIGARNLIPNSKQFWLGASDASNSNNSVQGEVIITGSGFWNAYAGSGLTDYTPGSSLTYQMEIKHNNSLPIVMTFYFYNNGDSQVFTQDIPPNVWTKVTKSSSPAFTTSILMGMGATGTDIGTKIYYRNLQAEEGKIPSTYRPAYEDFVLPTQLNDYWKKHISGPFVGFDSDSDFSFLNGNQAQRGLFGGLLISDNYLDRQYIPAKGLFSQGNIRTFGQFIGDYYSSFTLPGNQIINVGAGALTLGNSNVPQLNIETGNSNLVHYRAGYGSGDIWDAHNLDPVTRNTAQQITGKKEFDGATDNSYTGAGIMITGNGNTDTVYPTLAFHQPSLYAGTLQYRGPAYGFYFMNITGDSYEKVKANGFVKNGSDDNWLLLGGGGHKLISDFATSANLNNYIPTSQKAQPNGVATLDASGLVPATQLPSYVDDVLEFGSLGNFPMTGETGKIYVATNTNQTYRWSGSTYIEIASGAVQSVNGQVGLVNLTKSDVGLGNVDNTADSIKNVATARSLTNVNINLTELNSLTLQPGIYNAEGFVPGQGLTEAYHYIIQLGSYGGGGYRSQIAIPYSDGLNDSMYIRTSDGITWKDWERIAKNSDIAVAIDALNLSGTYEPVFSKNTAFNKNFGTTAGTVTEGNDSRVNNGQAAYDYGDHKSVNTGQYIGNTGIYVTDTTTPVTSFPHGISSYFVDSNSGWGSYGSLLNIKTYVAGGGSMQMYIPYSTAYGGDFIKYRRYNYGNEVWSDLRGFWDTGHFSPTDVDNWKNLVISAGSYVTQSSLNNQLNGVYATLNGVQTFSQTNTFSQNIIIPNATLGGHAVNANVLNANDRNFITDSRGAQRPPSFYDDRYAQWDFQHGSDTLAGGDPWHGVLTVSKWGEFNSAHRQEQLFFTGDDLKRRTATSDDTWGEVKTIWDSGNFNPDFKVNKSGDTMNGMLNFDNNVGGISGTMGDNDFYRIIGRANGSDNGYLEIATADGGIEPIHVTQYSGLFVSPIRTAKLLDENGNTYFPQNVTAEYALNAGSDSQISGRIFGKRELIDATGLNEDTYYPVAIKLPPSYPSRIKVYRTLDGSMGVPTYSEHGGGFWCYFEFDDYGRGWGVTDNLSICNYQQKSWTNIIPVGYSTINESSDSIIWVRGGSKYWIDINSNTPIVLYPNGYTSPYGQTVNPTTIRPWVDINRNIISKDLLNYVTQSSLDLQLVNYCTLNQLNDYLPNQNWGGHQAISNRKTIGEIAWKNYGNGHTIFDISSGTTPWGTSKSNVDAEIPWSSTYPTLVGGNGNNTFGVRVDSARIADGIVGYNVADFVRIDVPQTIITRKVITGGTDNSYLGTALEIKGNGSTVAPGISFHQPGVVASQIRMDGSGQVCIVDNPGNSYENFRAKVITGESFTSTIHGNSSQWWQAFNWGNHANAGYATQTWVSDNYMVTSHIANTITSANIQQWNNIAQYGLQLNSDFTVNTGSGLLIADNYFGGESGLIDKQQSRLLAAKSKDYYFYGSEHNKFDGLNFNLKRSLFGMGRKANDTDKLAVQGAVKASQNFKSEEERADTLFIPDGQLATLRDEIINDEDYAIRLDPHEYEIDSSGYLEVDDRNRLIHIIGEQKKMIVNFREIYPKQQIVIYNFDQSGSSMEVQIYGKTIYHIEPGCFLRLYVTRSRRVIAERQQPSEFIW